MISYSICLYLAYFTKYNILHVAVNVFHSFLWLIFYYIYIIIYTHIFFLFFEFYFMFLYSRFLLVIYFIHISVYMSIPISQFIPPPPPFPPTTRFPPLVSIRLSSTSVSLLLPCKQVHLYHFSRFHIYALIYNICFTLSDLLHSV